MNEKTEMLHNLCRALMEELEDYSKKIDKTDGMSAGDLEAVDKLSHALKSVKTVIAMIEAEDGDGGYSGGYVPRMGTYYDARGVSYSDGRGDEYGSSYARGRTNARRNSMGRYSGRGMSYADGMETLLNEMRELLPGMTEEKRRKAEQLMDELRR